MLTQDRNWDNIAFFNPSWQEPKHDVCTSSSSTIYVVLKITTLKTVYLHEKKHIFLLVDTKTKVVRNWWNFNIEEIRTKKDILTLNPSILDEVKHLSFPLLKDFFDSNLLYWWLRYNKLKLLIHFGLFLKDFVTRTPSLSHFYRNSYRTNPKKEKGKKKKKVS